MTEKTLIYQVKVGNNPPSYYDTCIESVSKYCKKYGIDHIVQTEPKLKIQPLNSHRSKNAMRLNFLPIFEKECAFEYLDQYDKIAIIDSDIYIRDKAPNLFDQINMDTDFAGVVEREMPITKAYAKKIKKYSQGQYQDLKDVDWKWNDRGAEFFNMGMMLITSNIKKHLKGQTPLEFIRRPEFEKFVNGEGNWRWSTDQTLLNYWVKKSGMKKKHLDWKWNVLFKGVKDEKLHDAYFIHFFMSANLPQKGEEIPEIVKDLSKAKNIKGHG